MINDFMEEILGTDYKSSRVHPVGRPPKITATLIEEICDLVIQGMSIAKAAERRKVSESTIFRWLAKGKEENAPALYKKLVESMDQAIEMSKWELLQVLRQATLGGKNWRASAWLLERRYPDEYGKATRNSCKCNSNDDVPAELSIVS